jgi:SAM-dependent methyltransferase
MKIRKALPGDLDAASLLAPSTPSTALRSRHYGADLARIHHEHFGMVARAAARELGARLAGSRGTVVDLAAGSGILSRAMAESGFGVLGVDISEDMLELARAEAKAATFVHGSLWSVDLPRCVGVAAVGEAFNYAVDPAASLAALEARLRSIHDALEPGGILLFDVAGPGRSGPSGVRRSFWHHGSVYLGFEEHERGDELIRDITIFAGHGGLFRRESENHVLRTYAPEAIEVLLDRLGFERERLARYDTFDFAPGWYGFAATRR